MRIEQRFTSGLDVAGNGLTGYAAVYGTEAVIDGQFRERFEPRAFDGVLDGDTVALFDHDARMLLGRTPLTLRLSSDERGLRYEVPKVPDARRDVLEAVERGDVRGSSLSFGVRNDDVMWKRDSGELPLRIIRKVVLVRDVGPVTHPAYSATSVEPRDVLRAAHALSVVDDERRAVRLRLAEVEV